MEQIVYDTNQLINYLKTSKTSLKGLTTIFNIIEFPKALELKDLEVIYPTIDDYKESLKISAALIKKEKPLPTIDILIAAICIRRDLTLSTLDQHFINIKSGRKDFKLKSNQFLVNCRQLIFSGFCRLLLPCLFCYGCGGNKTIQTPNNPIIFYVQSRYHNIEFDQENLLIQKKKIE